MRQNVAQNAPLVQCSLLPWLTAGRRRYPKKEQFDIVLFADGIYTERGALLLADAVTVERNPGIGALPDLVAPWQKSRRQVLRKPCPRYGPGRLHLLLLRRPL